MEQWGTIWVNVLVSGIWYFFVVFLLYFGASKISFQEFGLYTKVDMILSLIEIINNIFVGMRIAIFKIITPKVSDWCHSERSATERSLLSDPPGRESHD